MITPNLILGSLCLIVITGQFICIGSALYLSHTKKDIISSHFKHCSVLLIFGIHKGTTFYRRILLIGNISSIVTFPNFFISRKLITAEEIESFPSPLKRQLKILQWSFIGLIASMVSLVIIGRSGILN
ncbi:hypothetical protein CES87_01105 [Pseudomonas sp. ERMR1:02]|nr:hypothetical protein CES87_01105 [Pseudomonas sp. ERMR1:02]